MSVTDTNRDAWNTLAHLHDQTFRTAFAHGTLRLNAVIDRELGGDLAGKRVLHLQCNTGSDTLLLVRRGAARVTGVDIAPDNVLCANQLARDLGHTNVNFLRADIMELSSVLHGQYDVIFTSEGVLGWLPNLRAWGAAIARLLVPGGFLYVFDSHPFLMALDEDALARGAYAIKYPYFSADPDEDDSIGGYASESVRGVRALFWMHTVQDILSALIDPGLRLEFFHEFPELFFDMGGMEKSDQAGLYRYAHNRNDCPMSFSLRARK